MKPLRQEDYQAMAEENRRLTEENERLSSRRPVRWRRSALRVVAFAIGSGLVWGTWMAVSAFVSWVQSPSPKPCYFIAHTEYHDMPWDAYYIFKSNCKWFCSNSGLTKDGDWIKYQSKDDAWRFLQQWNMEACK